MTDLVLRLPHGRGMLRLVGYYQLGSDRIVVYDVLDEQDTRISDIQVTFPPQHPLVAAGARYPLAAEEIGPTSGQAAHGYTASCPTA